MNRFNVAVLCVLTSSMILGGCGDNTSSAQTMGGAGVPLRAEEFCKVAGLNQSLRHTLVFIDSGVIKPTSTPEEFVASNGWLRDAVLTFGDPTRAIPSRSMDYRERLSIYLSPAGSGGVREIFSGCIPALSPEEIEIVQGAESAVGVFVTGGQLQELQNAANSFRTRVIGALLTSSQAAPQEEPILGESPSEARLLQSIRSSGRVINSDLGVPRLVLITEWPELSNVDFLSIEEARKKGFEDGVRSGLDLGRSSLMMVQKANSSDTAREYADAFFLSQHAQLISWGTNPSSSASSAPVRINRYFGYAQYPDGPEAIQIRMGTDRNGRLVESWMVLRGNPDRATPLTGQAVCETERSCDIRSDSGGFAQVWSLFPGGAPEFEPQMPFAGLRDWEMRLDTESIKGRVFDPIVEISNSDEKSKGDGISFEATLQPKATIP